MAVLKIGPKHQVTIPAEVMKRLRLKAGDLLQVDIEDRVLRLVPQKLIPRDQAWFWTKEWQEMEGEADEAIERGDVSPVFENVDDLVRYLNRNGG